MEHFVRGLDTDAVRVVRRLLGAGHEAYLVGGCVRDLYLGKRPKDFDIATSATPESIRRLFRNSRIIGRRFKLVHVFFGPKVIETSTFRTAPKTDDSDDLLITHDNEWGTVEDDARRRDFTINGLFFDVETESIVDFVDGLADLESRVIRTIGDPATRFREDPVRMIRAIKFAVRLGFEFEPATWKALLDVAPDIVKCSKARVLEEIYKLLRGGSAQKTFKLLLEAKLLQVMMPDYVALYGDDPESGAQALIEAASALVQSSVPASTVDKHSSAVTFQRYLAALDDYTTHTRQVAANGVLQAILFAPLLGDELAEAPREVLEQRIEGLMNPVGTVFGVARRDRELARQILMTHRRMIGPSNRRRRASISQRQYFHDALIFLGVAVQATGDGGSELAHWQQLIQSLPRHTHNGTSPPSRNSKTRRKRRGRNTSRSSNGPRAGRER